MGTAPVRTAHLCLPKHLLTQVAEAAGLDPARVKSAEGSGIPDPPLCQPGQLLAQKITDPAALGSLHGHTVTQLPAA